MEPAAHTDTKALVADGAQAAWPICLGYTPIGLAFGVLAQKAGLSPLEIGLMSLFVFAGSSQFIAISMMGHGAAFAAIVATTFIVNLRHFLMSSSLSLYLKGRSRKFLSFFAYGITDESFAVNLGRFQSGGWDPRRALVVNQMANGAWVVSTVAGGCFGELVPEGAFGIDYALAAMFLCLLVFQLRGLWYAWTAAITGLLAVVLSLAIPGNSYVVLASLAGATIGFRLRRKFGRGGAP